MIKLILKERRIEMSKYLSNMHELRNSNLDFKSIYEIIFNGNAECIACEFNLEGKIIKWTYREYKDYILQAASRIQRDNINYRKGSYIGIKIANSPWWPVAFWSVLMSGYKPLLLDSSEDIETSNYLLKEAGACSLIASEDALEIKGNNIQDYVFKPCWQDEFALCTSGTTSTSRIFCYDGQTVSCQIMNSEEIFKNNARLRAEVGNKVLALLPFHNIYGFMANYLWCSFYGTTMVYLKDSNTDTVKEICKIQKVNCIITAPLLLNTIYKEIMNKISRKIFIKRWIFKFMLSLSITIQNIHTEAGLKLAKVMFKKTQKELLGENIKNIISAGSSTPIEVLKTLNGIGYFITSGYGKTEIGISSCEGSSNLKKRLKGSKGQAFQYFKYKILSESGDTPGELLIKGPAIHNGRLLGGNKVNANLSEGWFNTGDRALIINNSLYIYIEE